MSGYTTGTGNQLTASPGHTYTYDNEGNLFTDVSGGGTTTYTYDYHNRLTAVTVGGTIVATYVYDGLDRRIGFQDNGTQTWVVWDGVNPYADFNGSGTLLERYLYGPAIDELLARTDSGGTTAWYLTDRLGTVRDIANASASVIDHLSYSSYGVVLSESNSGNGDRYKFTGREFDAVTALQSNRARYYVASTGRWASQDPIRFDAGDANLYRYILDNPIFGIDPQGTLPYAPPGDNRGENAFQQLLDYYLGPPSRGSILTGVPILTPTTTPPVNTVMPPGATTVSPPSASSSVSELRLTGTQLIGVTGATPCSGLILQPQRPGLPWYGIHFGPLDSPSSTIDSLKIFGPAYEALICGSVSNTDDSNLVLAKTIRACKDNHIRIKGYVQSLNSFISKDGKIYEFGVSDDHPEAPPWRKR